VRRGKCRLIFQGGKQGATRQGWAKIRAEAEKGNLHRGEKEARKQQDLVGRKDFLRDKAGGSTDYGKSTKDT
jgi:hypothetical protein